jgi:hypothetical protein
VLSLLYSIRIVADSKISRSLGKRVPDVRFYFDKFQ